MRSAQLARLLQPLLAPEYSYMYPLRVLCALHGYEEIIHMGIFCPCCPAFWDGNGLLSYTCMQFLFRHALAMRTASMWGTPAPVAQLSGVTMDF